MELIQVRPDELMLVSNIREAQRSRGLDTLCASIRDHGVIEPISAYRAADGGLIVKHGHRRTLAALEAGVDTVPVVVAAPPSEDADGKAGLITAQWDENQQREGLTRREQADAIAQLAAFGVTPAQITKRLKVDRAVVDAATALNSTDSLDTYEFTIPQALVAAEFEDDGDSHARLVEAAEDGTFEYVAARLRQERAIAAEVALTIEGLEARGIEVRKERPSWNEYGSWVQFLRDEDGKRVVLDPEAPGEHVQAFVSGQVRTVHVPTGNLVNRWEIIHDSDPDTAIPERKVRASECEDRVVVDVEWYCSSPSARGWVDPNDGRVSTKDLSDEDREARREERRDTITANKAWLAAEEVRKSWLRTFCARKSAPKDSAAFVTATLLKRTHLMSHRVSYDAINYVDIETPEDFPATKATMTTLALVLVAHEINTCKEHWRTRDHGTIAYLRFLEGQGYPLSPVERRACGEEVSTDDL